MYMEQNCNTWMRIYHLNLSDHIITTAHMQPNFQNYPEVSHYSQILNKLKNNHRVRNKWKKPPIEYISI